MLCHCPTHLSKHSSVTFFQQLAVRILSLLSFQEQYCAMFVNDAGVLLQTHLQRDKPTSVDPRHRRCLELNNTESILLKSYFCFSADLVLAPPNLGIPPHERRKRGQEWPLGFLKFQQNRCFVSFEWEKTHFTTFAPLEKIRKIPSCPPHGKILSDTQPSTLQSVFHTNAFPHNKVPIVASQRAISDDIDWREKLTRNYVQRHVLHFSTSRSL